MKPGQIVTSKSFDQYSDLSTSGGKITGISSKLKVKKELLKDGNLMHFIYMGIRKPAEVDLDFILNFMRERGYVPDSGPLRDAIVGKKSVKKTKKKAAPKKAKA